MRIMIFCLMMMGFFCGSIAHADEVPVPHLIVPFPTHCPMLKRMESGNYYCISDLDFPLPIQAPMPMSDLLQSPLRWCPLLNCLCTMRENETTQCLKIGTWAACDPKEMVSVLKQVLDAWKPSVMLQVAQGGVGLNIWANEPSAGERLRAEARKKLEEAQQRDAEDALLLRARKLVEQCGGK